MTALLTVTETSSGDKAKRPKVKTKQKVVPNSLVTSLSFIKGSKVLTYSEGLMEELKCLALPIQLLSIQHKVFSCGNNHA